MAPILNPKTTTIVPIQGPKRKPPRRAMGEPKPKNGNTHKIVKSKKIKKIRIKLEFFNSKKYDRLFLIKSYEVSSFHNR